MDLYDSELVSVKGVSRGGVTLYLIWCIVWRKYILASFPTMYPNYHPLLDLSTSENIVFTIQVQYHAFPPSTRTVQDISHPDVRGMPIRIHDSR